MIVHVFEVLALVAAAYVIGCMLGAWFYELLARSRVAPQQGVVADAVGDVVDAVRDRFGIGTAWVPEGGWRAARRQAYFGVEEVEKPEAIEPAHEDMPRALPPAAAPETSELPAPEQASVASLPPPAPEVDGAHEEEAVPEEQPQAPADAGGQEHPLPVEDPAGKPLPEVAAKEGLPPARELPDDGITPMRPAFLSAPRNGVPDNLQRIRGVGERNEELLNGLGIFHFGQIAAWTPAEVRWISQYVAFPERIERDDWIGQATILASGGDTGFLKSADRRRARRLQQAIQREGEGFDGEEPLDDEDDRT